MRSVLSAHGPCLPYPTGFHVVYCPRSLGHNSTLSGGLLQEVGGPGLGGVLVVQALDQPLAVVASDEAADHLSGSGRSSKQHRSAPTARSPAPRQAEQAQLRGRPAAERPPAPTAARGPVPGERRGLAPDSARLRQQAAVCLFAAQPRERGRPLPAPAPTASSSRHLPLPHSAPSSHHHSVPLFTRPLPRAALRMRSVRDDAHPGGQKESQGLSPLALARPSALRL